ncbi:MAG: hypothetical protein JSU83_11885, partial [Deltaproteobacteria bacterium]
SLFDFLAGGIVIIFMVAPFDNSLNFFDGFTILEIFFYYFIWGGIGFICFLTGWKTLRFKPVMRFANIFISIFILIMAYGVAEFMRSRGSNPTWFLRLIFFYALWSIYYILQPKLKAKLNAYNQTAEADRM